MSEEVPCIMRGVSIKVSHKTAPSNVRSIAMFTDVIPGLCAWIVETIDSANYSTMCDNLGHLMRQLSKSSMLYRQLQKSKDSCVNA